MKMKCGLFVCIHVIYPGSVVSVVTDSCEGAPSNLFKFKIAAEGFFENPTKRLSFPRY